VPFIVARKYVLAEVRIWEKARGDELLKLFGHPDLEVAPWGMIERC